MRKYYILKQNKMMKCGLFLRIIRKDFDTGDFIGEWEDGTVQKGIKASSFADYDISHPLLKPFYKCTYMGFNCFRSKKIKNKVIYRCECSVCKDSEGNPLRDFLTPQQMIKHFNEFHKE